MKFTLLFIAVLLVFNLFSQTDYSVVLKDQEQFVLLTKNQLVDSVNLNQTGPEQFEYFEIKLSETDTLNAYTFMSQCRSIASIIERFGTPSIDICTWSNSDLKRPISGYYFAIGSIELLSGPQCVLKVIYPRFDNAPLIFSRN